MSARGRVVARVERDVIRTLDHIFEAGVACGGAMRDALERGAASIGLGLTEEATAHADEIARTIDDGARSLRALAERFRRAAR